MGYGKDGVGVVSGRSFMFGRRGLVGGGTKDKNIFLEKVSGTVMRGGR